MDHVILIHLQLSDQQLRRLPADRFLHQLLADQYAHRLQPGQRILHHPMLLILYFKEVTLKPVFDLILIILC